MSHPAPTHFVFVDFENVPVADIGAIRGQPVQVTLVIGKNQKAIAINLVKQIQEFAAQVTLIEVGASGHNALDLTLACYLGRAIERASAATFAIVSKDKDFAPMIAHLVDRDLEVARYDSFTALPFLSHPKPPALPKSAGPAKSSAAAKKSPEDRAAKVIARLRNPLNPHRPTTLKTLRAHLKTSLGKESSDARVEALFQQLCDEGVLHIGANEKVEYTAVR